AVTGFRWSRRCDNEEAGLTRFRRSPASSEEATTEPADGGRPSGLPAEQEAEQEPDLLGEPVATSRSSWRRRSAIVREVRSWPTLVLVLLCLFGGVSTTILLTPAQSVTVAGQTLSVSARPPSFSLSG